MSKNTPLPWREPAHLKGYVYAANDELVCMAQEEEDAPVLAASQDLLAAAKAALAYDAAIRRCANDPEKMASFCTAQGESLDTLYADWIGKSRAAVVLAGEAACTIA